jgi:hypothetical protein
VISENLAVFLHGRIRHGDCSARSGDVDQLKPSSNFGLVLGDVAADPTVRQHRCSLCGAGAAALAMLWRRTLAAGLQVRVGGSAGPRDGTQ